MLIVHIDLLSLLRCDQSAEEIKHIYMTEPSKALKSYVWRNIVDRNQQNMSHVTQ